MAKTIFQLPPAATLDAEDVLPVSQSGVTAKATIAQVRAGLATAAQGAKADSAVQPAALASGLAGKADMAALSAKLDASAVSAFGASLIDDADAATARATLGLGTAATQSIGAFATAAQGTKADTAVQPTDLAAGLAGKAASVHAHDASAIVSGTIDIARLPVGALDRLVRVANQSARYALTVATVQQGDTVQELDTGQMYIVVDEANLGNSTGYVQYTAGSAASAPWAGITGKPTTLGGYGITDAATATALAAKSDVGHAHTAAADVYPAVKAILSAGSGVSVTAADAAKTLTVAASGVGGAGGVTLSPTDRSATCRLSPDRLVFSTRSGGGGWVRSSAALPSAKVYFEARWSGATGSAATVGVATAAAALSWVGSASGSTGFAMDGGNVWSNGGSSAYSTSPASGSTLMVALDPAAGKGWVGVAGAWLNSGDPVAGTNPTFTTNVSPGNFVALGVGGAGLSDIWTVRFAAETWERAAPTGFGAMA